MGRELTGDSRRDGTHSLAASGVAQNWIVDEPA